MSSISSRLFPVAVLLITSACLTGITAAQNQQPTDIEATAIRKAFEGIVAFSQTLSGWALLIAGGSIVTLVGTSYYRPQCLWVRSLYLAFVPGWFFLGESMYFGVQVQRSNLGFLFAKSGISLAPYKSAVNDDALRQMLAFQHALYCFGAWLISFLLWWVFHSENPNVDGDNP